LRHAIPVKILPKVLRLFWKSANQIGAAARVF